MEHAGAAAATTLSSSITNASTTINVASATGWPTGSIGPFVVTIDAGTASEEKVLVLSRTGTVLTVQTRGYDGTTAASHGATAAIIHSFSATEADEANALAAQVTTSGGSVVTTTAAQTLSNKTLTASGPVTSATNVTAPIVEVLNAAAGPTTATMNFSGGFFNNAAGHGLIGYLPVNIGGTVRYLGVYS